MKTKPFCYVPLCESARLFAESLDRADLGLNDTYTSRRQH